MFAERKALSQIQTHNGVLRTGATVRSHFHSGFAVKNDKDWAVWGGRPQYHGDIHSCGTRESERCRAASELRALYVYLEACKSLSALTVRMSHPRALAQVQYWLVADANKLTVPRRYIGTKLHDLASLVHERRGMLTVHEANQTDSRWMLVGTQTHKQVQNSLCEPANNADEELRSAVTPIFSQLRR